MQEEAEGASRVVEALRRPWVAALVVLAVYALLALTNSTGGYLGTDTGAKVITLDRMVEDGTLRPEVGYWAEEWDPDGDYHPLLDSRRNDEGQWINVTTLPMLVASYPLYAAGGYRLSLLWPMVGAALAAFACRDVVRQLDDERAGWTAFWVTALASPITIYALDLWEHSLGAGLMVSAFALLLRVVRGSRVWALPLLAGAALGASATMRTESFVVAVAFVGVACVTLLLRRRVAMAVLAGGLAVAGFAVPWALNALLEDALGGSSRASRVADASQREWWSELSERGREALITWFGVANGDFPATVLLGAAIVGSFALAGVLARRREQRAAVLAAGAGVLCYAVSLSAGLAFVPGALVAAPLAGAVLLLTRWDGDRRFVLVAALVATAITWMFQYTGGASPQWGGRYLLAPTLLLLCLGVIGIRSAHAFLRRTLLVSSVVVTAFGVLWLQVRSHEVEDFFAELASQPEDVVVSTNGFLVREAGPAHEDRRYLSIGRGGDLAGAVDVVDEAGLGTFGVLTADDEAPDLDGASPRRSTTVELLGVPLWYHAFAVDPGR